MPTSVFYMTLWERRRSILGWVIGMVMLAGLTIAFYPSIRADAESFQELFESLPEGLLTVFGIEDTATLATATGLVNSRLYAGIGPVILAVLGISLGTSAIAGEEENGTLNLLLALPISRTKVVVQKFSAGALLVGIVVLAIFITLLIFNPVVDLGFSISGMLGANIALGLLALVFSTLALAIGATTGNRGFTLGLSAAITTAAFFMNGLAPLVDQIAWTRNSTPFHWLQGPDPLTNGLDLGATALMLVVIATLLATAIWGFNRRDVGV